MKPLGMAMAALAMGGAALTTSLLPEYRFWGFAVWIVSNGYLLREFFRQKQYEWVLVYIIYEIFNVLGAYNNWSVFHVTS
jgi:hypothetical protein